MDPSACKLFAGIDDPRVVGRITHSLAEILFAALCATLCGFGCRDGYAQFARAKVDFLRRYLPYEDGTPFHDTFGRLLRLIKPEQFEAVLADLARRVTAGSAGPVAINGKTVRGSADVRRGVPALHLLYAFATDVGLCIGQVAVDGKSNEITALRDLLGLLDLRERDVTMDALHTQRTSAKLLHETGAHYVMALKGNQATPAANPRGFCVFHGTVARLGVATVSDTLTLSATSQSRFDPVGSEAGAGRYLAQNSLAHQRPWRSAPENVSTPNVATVPKALLSRKADFCGHR